MLDLHRNGERVRKAGGAHMVAASIRAMGGFDLLLSSLLGVLGTLPVAPASEHRRVASLQRLLRLIVLGLAAALPPCAIRRGREARLVWSN
jgi:hypothetical protein